MAESVLSRPGADLAYDGQGDGPVLGYSHGVLQSRAADAATGLFDWAPVTAGHRLVRYDARGHGRSTGETEPATYEWPRLAEDLRALAHQVGGGEPVDWAGQSMGTGTLLWAAVQEPALFHRLVLMIPPSTGATRVAAATLYRQGAGIVERDGMTAWTSQLAAVVPAIFRDVPGWQLGVDVAEPLLPSVLRGAAATDLPPREALATITQRALVLSWESDGMHPVSSAELVADALPGAELHVSGTADDVRGWPSRIAKFLAR